MEISDDIKVKKAVRMGKGPHHSLKIELGNPDDKSVVFANASNLKGKENARKRLFFVMMTNLSTKGNIADTFNICKVKIS